MSSHLVSFALVTFTFGIKSKKSPPKLFMTFSSRIYMAAGLMIKSLIDFELISVNGIREWFSFIFCM